MLASAVLQRCSGNMLWQYFYVCQRQLSLGVSTTCQQAGLQCPLAQPLQRSLHAAVGPGARA